MTVRLKALRWLVENQLGRASDTEGEDILAELDAAIEADEIDRDMPRFEYPLDMPGIFDSPDPPDDGLVDFEQRCKKCDAIVCSSVMKGVTPFPICPMCRVSGQDQKPLKKE